MAKPWPEILPPEYLIRESALCPQITPGIAAKIEKQARLKIPSTRLQTARAEVLGGALIVIGGMASFITFDFGFERLDFAQNGRKPPGVNY
jgi:hypothetical protein